MLEWTRDWWHLIATALAGGAAGAVLLYVILKCRRDEYVTKVYECPQCLRRLVLVTTEEAYQELDPFALVCKACGHNPMVEVDWPPRPPEHQNCRCTLRFIELEEWERIES